jgi:hypothetical protein
MSFERNDVGLYLEAKQLYSAKNLVYIEEIVISYQIIKDTCWCEKKSNNVIGKRGRTSVIAALNANGLMLNFVPIVQLRFRFSCIGLNIYCFQP